MGEGSTREETVGVPGLVFDIDGTLLDTNYLHVIAWSAAFCEHGFTVQMADIHRAIGLPSADLVKHLVDQERPDLVETHSEQFDQVRERHGVNALAGAGDLLHRCAQAGWRIALATSAAKSDLEWMRPLIDADDVIAGATTSHDVQEGKPNPEAMTAAMEAYGLDATRTIAIGDSIWDVKSAERAGIPCIGVASGGVGAAELQRAGATEVYDDVAGLLEEFQTSLLGTRAPRS